LESLSLERQRLPGRPGAGSGGRDSAWRRVRHARRRTVSAAPDTPTPSPGNS
jgi:hypothetical protein